ncbi:syntaxin binding protein 1, partial [Coemansia sp. RSA 2399]
MAIQLITRSRQQYPDVEAVYILVPCEDSVARVIDDFRPGLDQSSVASTKYSRAHLFFTGAISDALLSTLRQSPAAPYIKGIDELFIEYNPIESRVFLTTPSEQPFYALYSPHSSDMAHRDLDAAADRLLSVIACLDIRPYIRYYRPEQSPAAKAAECPKIAEIMAEKIHQKLDTYYARRATSSKSKRERPNKVSPSVVIVLDRSVDMYAPLLHEFTYQAAVHDLIDLEDGCKYTYEVSTVAGKTQQANATLSEQTDKIWRVFRHEHVCRVAEELVAQFDTMVKKNIGVKAAHEPGKKLKLGELRAAISELPEFNQLQAIYSLHIDLATTSKGEPVNRTSIETRLISLLDDQAIEKYDRIRLLFLYLVMVNGGNELDRRRLEQIPQCLTINDRRAAVNLRQLGIPTKNTTAYSGSDSNRPADKYAKYEWDTTSQTSREALGTRFVPAVYSILR